MLFVRIGSVVNMNMSGMIFLKFLNSRSTTTAAPMAARTGEIETSGLSFHAFPKAPLQRAKWIQAVKRKDFKITKSTVLCSEHFRSSDYYLSKELDSLTSKKLCRSLLPDVASTVFSFRPVQFVSTSPDDHQRVSKSRQEEQEQRKALPKPGESEM